MAVTAANVRPDANPGRSLRQDYDAGGSLTVGNAVYVASDGDIEAADANGAASVAAIGILAAVQDQSGGVTTLAANERGTVVTFGLVYGFTGLTPGAIQYISETAGAITETAPTGAGTWTYAIGYAVDANTLFVLPGLVAPVSNS